MFERFTERARQVIVLAKEESRTLHNGYIGVEHLLLGCIREGEGLAWRALDNLDVCEEAETLRQTLNCPPSSDDPQGEVPFHPEAKKVLELALREALTLGHNYIGTEHVLLAIAREPGELTQSFLQGCIDDRWAENIRLEVMELLKGPRPKKDPDLTAAEVEELKLKDVLADILIGFRMWQEAKVSSAEWTDEDEAFARWVDGSNVSEFL